METQTIEMKSNQREAKIGDVFVYTWGYDQTNADFFQVVGLTAKCVKLKAINGTTTETGFMCGNKVPKINNFKNDDDSKVLRKKIYYYNQIPHVNMEYGCCELWDGQPERISWYA